MKLSERVLFFCLVASISSGAASAQLFRTYLSFNGMDANPCTVQLPCRVLPAALAAVQNGGDIWMLDSADYNTAPVNITTSVKILAIPGAVGSVVGNGGDAMVIDASGSNISLRNLVVLNFAGGVNGIRILDAGAVHIEKVSIDGFNTDASSCIHVSPVGAASVYVDCSFLRECRTGILAKGSAAGRPGVDVDNTRIERG